MDEITKLEEMIMIAVWRLKDEAYGYKIRSFISEKIKKDFSYGNLYSVLGQLVRKEFVIKSSLGDNSQKQGKQKIYYTVSPKGIQALRESHEVHNLLWDGISDPALNKF